MSCIRARRQELDLSPRALGERLGMTGDAALALEAAENTGAATVGAIEQALQVMGRTLMIVPVPLVSAERLGVLERLARQHMEQASERQRVFIQPKTPVNTEREELAHLVKLRIREALGR